MFTLEPTHKTNTFIVTVQSDANDADYMYSTTEIEEKDFESYISIIKLIDGSRKMPDLEDDEIRDTVYELVPTDSEGECHSIEVISIEFINKDGKLHNVILE